MSYYDLTRLNDKEFEDLSIDLLKKILNLDVIERFKVGRDGGIDGRFYSTDGTVIIQCKHYIKSTFYNLLSTLRTEAPKVKKLNPSRYILTISQPLSAKNKEEIVKIIGSQYLVQQDIFNIEEICGYISEFKDIELKYYKLWLHNTELLTAILHSDVLGNSKFIVDQIKEKSDIYVQTNDFEIATRKIEETKSIIITGDPGVGKTTLAEQLCLFYIIKGYQLVYIENDINEAERLIKDDVNQLFLFDDFLGRNYLDAILNNADSKTLQFIKRVRKLENKRFILTSRTTILNQGKSVSELFKIDNSHKHEYELNLTSLSNLEKAKILYNHIWQSNLPQEHKDVFWENKRYRAIINHKNFNPRLISFITDSDKVGELTPEEYVAHISKSLHNPSDIWEHMFTRQLHHLVYILTLITSLNNGNIKEGDLRVAYYNYIESINLNSSSERYLSFDEAVKLSLNSTLKRTLNNNIISYDVVNPSISDYLIPKLNVNVADTANCLSSLGTIASLKNTETLSLKILLPYTLETVIKKILESFIEKTREYKLYFLNMVLSGSQFSEVHKNNVAELINSGVIPYDNQIDSHSLGLLKGINYLLSSEEHKVNKEQALELIDLMMATPLSHEEICELGIALIHLGVYDNRIMELRSELKDYWEGYIQDEINQNPDFEKYYEDESIDEINHKAFTFLFDTLQAFPYPFSEEEVEEIMVDFNPEAVIFNNRDSSYEYEDYYEPEYSKSDNSSFDVVDDLFYRE